MASSILALVDAHDIVDENQDLDVVLSYVEHLNSNSLLQNSSSKTIQSLVAATHTCLHSKKCQGKTIGLVCLQSLSNECHDEVFVENASNWFSKSKDFLQKGPFEAPFQRLLLSVIRILVQRAPQHPEISKQLTSVISSVVESILKVQEKLPSLADDCVSTIVSIFKQYPGSCGSTRGRVEKYLIANMETTSFLSGELLAKCFALTWRLGGGGKEGIEHKANFVTLFQRFACTLDEVTNEILSLSVQFKAKSGQKCAEPFKLPKCDGNDLLKKSLSLQYQFEAIALCLCELITVPFHHYKTIRPGLIFNVLKNLFENPLSEFSKSEGNEAKVLLFIIPSLQNYSLRVIKAFLKSCKTSMVLFVPVMVDFIMTMLSDFRNFTEPMTSLRIGVYDLLTEICETFGAMTGLEHVDKDMVSYVLADLVPIEKNIVIKSAASMKNKKKPSNFVAMSSKNESQLNHQVFPKACQALGSIIKAVGPLISEVVFKQIQCVLISTGLEQCGSTSSDFPKESKLALYKSLILMIEKSPNSCPNSLQLVSHLFNLASQNESSSVKEICQHGMALCMKLSQPGRASMHLDLPMEVKSMQEIVKEVSKVHVYYLGNSSYGTTSITFQKSNSAMSIGDEESNSTNTTTSFANGKPEVNGEKGKQKDTLKNKRLLEANEVLKECKNLNKRVRVEGSKENNPEVDEDLPSKEEAERLVKEVYSMDNEPIFIPENVKNRVKKKHNSDISSDSMHSNSKEMDDKIDTETRIENMLMDFDGTLKE